MKTSKTLFRKHIWHIGQKMKYRSCETLKIEKYPKFSYAVLATVQMKNNRKVHNHKHATRKELYFFSDPIIFK